MNTSPATVPMSGMPIFCDVPSFTDFEKGFSDQINQLVTLTGVPADYQKSQVRYPISAFMRRVFLCPGSENHHDSCPGGLVSHTLAVCRHVLEIASQNPELNFKDRLAIFAVALVHDVVRASHIDVIDVSPEPGKIKAKQWEATHEGMARWIEGAGITRVSMAFSPKREIYGLSEASSVVFILKIFHESFRLLVGQRRESAMIYALTSRLTHPCIDIYRYFKGADRIMVEREVVGVSENDVPLVVDSLKRVIEAHHNWNNEPYYFLASDTHIIVPYTLNSPDPRVEQFWRGIHAIVCRNYVQDKHNQKTRRVVLDVIKSYLVAVCRTGDIEKDMLFLVERDGKRRASVAIAWDSILGRQQKRPRLDAPPPTIRIYPFNNNDQTVITHTDLGFPGVNGSEPISILEAGYISEIWRHQVTPPFSKAEKKISDKILESGRIDPDQKLEALDLLRMRANRKAK